MYFSNGCSIRLKKCSNGAFKPRLVYTEKKGETESPGSFIYIDAHYNCKYIFKPGSMVYVLYSRVILTISLRLQIFSQFPTVFQCTLNQQNSRLLWNVHYKNIRQLWSIWLIENQFNSTGYDCFLRKVVPEVCRTDEQNHAGEVEGTGVPALAVPVNLYNNLYIGGRLDALAGFIYW